MIRICCCFDKSSWRDCCWPLFAVNLYRNFFSHIFDYYWTINCTISLAPSDGRTPNLRSWLLKCFWTRTSTITFFLSFSESLKSLVGMKKNTKYTHRAFAQSHSRETFLIGLLLLLWNPDLNLNHSTAQLNLNFWHTLLLFTINLLKLI